MLVRIVTITELLLQKGDEFVRAHKAACSELLAYAASPIEVSSFSRANYRQLTCDYHDLEPLLRLFSVICAAFKNVPAFKDFLSQWSCVSAQQKWECISRLRNDAKILQLNELKAWDGKTLGSEARSIESMVATHEISSVYPAVIDQSVVSAAALMKRSLPDDSVAVSSDSSALSVANSEELLGCLGYLKEAAVNPGFSSEVVRIVGERLNKVGEVYLTEYERFLYRRLKAFLEERLGQSTHSVTVLILLEPTRVFNQSDLTLFDRLLLLMNLQEGCAALEADQLRREERAFLAETLVGLQEIVTPVFLQKLSTSEDRQDLMRFFNRQSVQASGVAEYFVGTLAQRLDRQRGCDLKPGFVFGAEHFLGVHAPLSQCCTSYQRLACEWRYLSGGAVSADVALASSTQYLRALWPSEPERLFEALCVLFSRSMILRGQEFEEAVIYFMGCLLSSSNRNDSWWLATEVLLTLKMECNEAVRAKQRELYRAFLKASLDQREVSFWMNTLVKIHLMRKQDWFKGKPGVFEIEETAWVKACVSFLSKKWLLIEQKEDHFALIKNREVVMDFMALCRQLFGEMGLFNSQTQAECYTEAKTQGNVLLAAVFAHTEQETLSVNRRVRALSVLHEISFLLDQSMFLEEEQFSALIQSHPDFLDYQKLSSLINPLSQRERESIQTLFEGAFSCYLVSQSGNSFFDTNKWYFLHSAKLSFGLDFPESVVSKAYDCDFLEDLSWVDSCNEDADDLSWAPKIADHGVGCRETFVQLSILPREVKHKLLARVDIRLSQTKIGILKNLFEKIKLLLINDSDLNQILNQIELILQKIRVLSSVEKFQLLPLEAIDPAVDLDWISSELDSFPKLISLEGIEFAESEISNFLTELVRRVRYFSAVDVFLVKSIVSVDWADRGLVDECDSIIHHDGVLSRFFQGRSKIGIDRFENSWEKASKFTKEKVCKDFSREYIERWIAEIGGDQFQFVGDYQVMERLLKCFRKEMTADDKFSLVKRIKAQVLPFLAKQTVPFSLTASQFKAGLLLLQTFVISPKGACERFVRLFQLDSLLSQIGVLTRDQQLVRSFLTEQDWCSGFGAKEYLAISGEERQWYYLLTHCKDDELHRAQKHFLQGFSLDFHHSFRDVFEFEVLGRYVRVDLFEQFFKREMYSQANILARQLLEAGTPEEKQEIETRLLQAIDNFFSGQLDINFIESKLIDRLLDCNPHYATLRQRVLSLVKARKRFEAVSSVLIQRLEDVPDYDSSRCNDVSDKLMESRLEFAPLVLSNKQIQSVVESIAKAFFSNVYGKSDEIREAVCFYLREAYVHNQVTDKMREFESAANIFNDIDGDAQKLKRFHRMICERLKRETVDYRGENEETQIFFDQMTPDMEILLTNLFQVQPDDASALMSCYSRYRALLKDMREFILCLNEFSYSIARDYRSADFNSISRQQGYFYNVVRFLSRHIQEVRDDLMGSQKRTALIKECLDGFHPVLESFSHERIDRLMSEGALNRFKIKVEAFYQECVWDCSLPVYLIQHLSASVNIQAFFRRISQFIRGYFLKKTKKDCFMDVRVQSLMTALKRSPGLALYDSDCIKTLFFPVYDADMMSCKKEISGVETQEKFVQAVMILARIKAHFPGEFRSEETENIGAWLGSSRDQPENQQRDLSEDLILELFILREMLEKQLDYFSGKKMRGDYIDGLAGIYRLIQVILEPFFIPLYPKILSSCSRFVDIINDRRQSILAFLKVVQQPWLPRFKTLDLHCRHALQKSYCLKSARDFVEAKQQLLVDVRNQVDFEVIKQSLLRFFNDWFSQFLLIDQDRLHWLTDNRDEAHLEKLGDDLCEVIDRLESYWKKHEPEVNIGQVLVQGLVSLIHEYHAVNIQLSESYVTSAKMLVAQVFLHYGNRLHIDLEVQAFKAIAPWFSGLHLSDLTYFMRRKLIEFRQRVLNSFVLSAETKDYDLLRKRFLTIKHLVDDCEGSNTVLRHYFGFDFVSVNEKVDCLREHREAILREMNQSPLAKLLDSNPDFKGLLMGFSSSFFSMVSQDSLLIPILLEYLFRNTLNPECMDNDLLREKLKEVMTGLKEHVSSYEFSKILGFCFEALHIRDETPSFKTLSWVGCFFSEGLSKEMEHVLDRVCQDQAFCEEAKLFYSRTQVRKPHAFFDRLRALLSSSKTSCPPGESPASLLDSSSTLFSRKEARTESIKVWLAVEVASGTRDFSNLREEDHESSQASSSRAGCSEPLPLSSSRGSGL